MNPMRSEERRTLYLLSSGCRTTRDVASKMLIPTERVLRLCYRLEKRGFVERAGSVVLDDAPGNTSHSWRVSSEGKRFLKARER